MTRGDRGGDDGGGGGGDGGVGNVSARCRVSSDASRSLDLVRRPDCLVY
jgi:hypothetical protein